MKIDEENSSSCVSKIGARILQNSILRAIFFLSNYKGHFSKFRIQSWRLALSKSWSWRLFFQSYLPTLILKIPRAAKSLIIWWDKISKKNFLRSPFNQKKREKTCESANLSQIFQMSLQPLYRIFGLRIYLRFTSAVFTYLHFLKKWFKSQINFQLWFKKKTSTIDDPTQRTSGNWI